MTALAATLDRSTFLRRVLCVDAATSVATGALLSLESARLATLLGFPDGLLFWAGVALFPITAFMLWTGLARDLSRPAVWTVIIGNAGWVAGSVLLLLATAPTGPGYAFVIVQAVVVALLAELEYVGLRRLSA